MRNQKHNQKHKVPLMFPTLDEWERMPQQSKDAYLAQLQRPSWFSEPEPSDLTSNERTARYKSFRECEFTQFLLHLAEQQSVTRKGMEANVRAGERTCNKVLEELFPLPPAASSFQPSDLISLRENWIKLCETQKRADMELYYQSQHGSLSPQQEKQLEAAAARNLKELQDKRADNRKRRRTLTQKEISDNIKKNELIAEIRRRAKNSYTRGNDGITAAYDEIAEESSAAGSKWREIIGLVPRNTIIDKARHNRKYKTTP